MRKGLDKEIRRRRLQSDSSLSKNFSKSVDHRNFKNDKWLSLENSILVSKSPKLPKIPIDAIDDGDYKPVQRQSSVTKKLKFNLKKIEMRKSISNWPFMNIDSKEVTKQGFGLDNQTKVLSVGRLSVTKNDNGISQEKRGSQEPRGFDVSLYKPTYNDNYIVKSSSPFNSWICISDNHMANTMGISQFERMKVSQNLKTESEACGLLMRKSVGRQSAAQIVSNDVSKLLGGEGNDDNTKFMNMKNYSSEVVKLDGVYYHYD